MTETYYWCTAEDFGEQTTLDSGGYYEKIDETGWPVQMKFGGYARSEHPEVCMSKSPEACLFALTHNVNTATTLHIYQTSQTPDFDISDAGMDFGVMKEVRYRNPQETPIPIRHHTSVDLPQRAFDDATQSYNPHGPYQDPPDVDMHNGDPVFILSWGKAVKSALHTVLNGERYPDSIDWKTPYSEWEK